MRKRKTVYCDYKFLKEYVCTAIVPDPYDEESNRRYNNWQSFKNFILDANLYINATKDDLTKEEPNNRFIHLLLKKGANGECRINYVPNSFPDIEKIEGDNINKDLMNSVFFIDLEDEIINKKSKDFGIFIINRNIASNSDHLFKDNGKGFGLREHGSWDFIDELLTEIPSIRDCNSMLIIDNYLFEDDCNRVGELIETYKEKINKNLIPILKDILPLTLIEGEVFQIDFYAGKGDLEEQREFLYKKIKVIRPNLNFSLTVFNMCDEIFHDRAILTNNLFLQCGKGFDLFNKSGICKKPTSVGMSFPFLQKYSQRLTDEYRKSILAARNRLDQGTVYTTRFKNWPKDYKTNRLIEYYCQNEGTVVEEKTVFKTPHGKIELKKIGKIDLSLIIERSKRRV